MSAAADKARAQASRAQQPAADPTSSVWVAASAGTGKTKVLTDRVLSLMLHGTAPARILCLTFTKAAAAEMSNRLAQRLAFWATMEDEELNAELEGLLGRAPDEAPREEARRLFARVLDAPGGMKIQTIHSFCQSLLGRFPLEAEIAPHFQALDERSADELLQEAREELLAMAWDDNGGGEAPATPLAAAIAEVSVQTHEQGFRELLIDLVKQRARLSRLLRRHGGIEGLEAAVFVALGIEPGETMGEVLSTACADDAFDHMGLRLAAGVMADGSKTDQAHGARIAAWLEQPDQRQPQFAEYLKAFFTKDGEGDVFKTLVHKDALAAAPGIDDVLAGEAMRLTAVRARINAITVARATAALLRLGDAILDLYKQRKAARAVLDYDDLILGARDLLQGQGSASWVLYKLDGGLDHILIDEAQDTNPEQWEVIQYLAEEFFTGEGAQEETRTVFAVGDAKQSIYSFQRADPDSFDRMRAHFAARAAQAGQRLDAIGLQHSFRSSAAVLQAVDAVFAREAAQPGVLFGEGPLEHSPVRLGQAGLVELWPPAGPPEEVSVEAWEPPVARRQAAPTRTRLAKLIARKIEHWTREPLGKKKLQDSDAWLETRQRRVRPGDILVLVRRRNEFVEELVRELKRLEVPVAGVDRMVLRDQIAVMDLVALGRVLLLPEDDLTLATVLKGPLVGLREEQLFTLAYKRKGSLWASLARQAKGDAAFAAARTQLADLMARADFVPPYELFAEILERDWGRGRGRELLLARLGLDAGDPIEEFLSLALAYEREHAPSLEGFLHWLEAGAQVVKRDMEHGQDSVRVMTVHGAKGLQAPIVILPDTMQNPKTPSGLFWPAEEEEAIALWPLRVSCDGPLAARLRAEAQARQAREYRRLLYVALTRAEDRLYVCGWDAKTKPPEDCWYKLVEDALAGVAEAVDFDFTKEGEENGWRGPGRRLSTAQTAAADKIETDEPVPAPEKGPPLPDWTQTQPTPEPAPPRPLAPSRPAGAEPPLRSPLGEDGGAGFQRGRLIHRLLQSLPGLPREARAAAAARFLESPVHGLSKAARAEIARVTLDVLDHPDFAALFGPGSRAEVPVTGLIECDSGPEVVSGQIDRLLVAPGHVLIVDYKTQRPAPAAETDIPTIYIRQMAVYRAILKGVYPGRPVTCALLWTDGPRLMQLSSATLAQHAP
ncbi:MAG: double-strand break repair helicase AddA [Kiloniellales bacterium]